MLSEKEEICDMNASFDGTWQYLGYASFNGVVTAVNIENGKCLAYEFLTKNCKSCAMQDLRQGAEEYDSFFKPTNAQ